MNGEFNLDFVVSGKVRQHVQLCAAYNHLTRDDIVERLFSGEYLTTIAHDALDSSYIIDKSGNKVALISAQETLTMSLDDYEARPSREPAEPLSPVAQACWDAVIDAQKNDPAQARRLAWLAEVDQAEKEGRRSYVVRPFDQYPLGTKALALSGEGYWLRVKAGWLWTSLVNNNPGDIVTVPGRGFGGAREGSVIIPPETTP